ncbi:MAG: hypothetical protein SFY56_14975 [Bacteroidota bacterium]|nr:hypothetical protein [Bacteroidota bacterium]
MSLVSRKEFERLYSAELLPASGENYSIGDIWDWEGLINQKLVFRFESVTDVVMNEELKQKLKNIPLVQGNLPEVDMTSDIKIDAGAAIPVLKDINVGNNLDVKSIVKFSFGNVMSKNILDYRMDFNRELEKLKNQNFDKYKEKIRNYEVVMQYWYAGSVNLVVDKTVGDTANIKAKIQGMGLEFKSDVTTDNKETISIKTSKAPFAAQFMKGRDL